MSDSNCCFLTCIQVSQEAGQVVLYYDLFKDFPVCCDPHSQRLWWSLWSRCFFSGIVLLFLWSNDVVSLIYGSSAFSKSSLYIWKLMVHIILKPSLKDFEHYLANMWHACNCLVVLTYFGIALFGTLNLPLKKSCLLRTSLFFFSLTETGKDWSNHGLQELRWCSCPVNLGPLFGLLRERNNNFILSPYILRCLY